MKLGGHDPILALAWSYVLKLFVICSRHIFLSAGIYTETCRGARGHIASMFLTHIGLTYWLCHGRLSMVVCLYLSRASDVSAFTTRCISFCTGRPTHVTLVLCGSCDMVGGSMSYSQAILMQFMVHILFSVHMVFFIFMFTVTCEFNHHTH